jgi:SpoIIAA-like
MPALKLHESKFFQLSNYSSEPPYLELIWAETTGEMSEEEYRNHVKLYLETVCTHKPNRILVDTSYFYFHIAPQTQLWINEEIFPATIEAGLEKMAIIVSRDFISMLSVEQTMSENPNLGFSVHYFVNKEDALAWLLLDLNKPDA